MPDRIQKKLDCVKTNRRRNLRELRFKSLRLAGNLPALKGHLTTWRKNILCCLRVLELNLRELRFKSLRLAGNLPALKGHLTTWRKNILCCLRVLEFSHSLKRLRPKGGTHDLDTSEIAHLFYLSLSVMVLLSSLVVIYRDRLGQALQHIAILGLIPIGVVLAYGFKDHLTAVIMPDQGLELDDRSLSFFRAVDGLFLRHAGGQRRGCDIPDRHRSREPSVDAQGRGCGG